MLDRSVFRRDRRRRARVPYVQQLEASDCGAACLAMVLGYFGHHIPLSKVREVLAVGTSGLDARTLLRGAQGFGLRGDGVKIEVEDLRFLPAGAIIHWSFGHWIVFERLERRGVRVVDPAGGRRLLPLEQFRAKFTGVALVFRTTPSFETRKQSSPGVTPYLRRLFTDKKLLASVLVMTGLLQLLGMSLPAITGVVVDRVVPHQDLSMLTTVGVGGLAIVVFGLASSLVRTFSLVRLRVLLDFELATGFVEHLTSLPYAFFARRQTGDLMMRVNSNAQIREFLTSTVVSALLDGLLTVGYLVVISLLSKAMALLVLGLGLARLLVLFAIRRRLTESMAAQLDASARSQGHLAEMIAGIDTLKAAGRERTAVGRWIRLYSAELEEVAHRSRIDGAAQAVLGALDTLSPFAVLGTGAMLAMSGELSMGMMLALVALASAFLTPLSALVAAGTQLSLLRAYVERVEDVAQAEPEHRAGHPRVQARPLGAISVRDVSFRYGVDQPLVLRHVSLDVRSGQTIAIVGESGSGKTTLAKLLLGLYLPTEGEIAFDGQSIRDLDLTCLRSQLGVVSQHPYLFAGSVRDNISLGDETVPLSRVVSAARIAKIHDDVMRLPMGYESQLPDRGASLSGGQRQRVALARAILSRPSILLLDEATSALDSRTERSVTNSIGELQCTRIVIAHRMSTIAAADVILVLENGQIVERGRHEELLQNGDIYRALIGDQAGSGWGSTA